MKLLKLSVAAMAVLGVALVAGSLLSSFGYWDAYYRSPVFLVLVAAFTAVLIFTLIRFPFSLKKWGFYLCHLGVLLIVVCSFVSWKCTKNTSFSIPVNSHAFYGEVMQNDGTELAFGFDISIASFDVEKYEPDYRLYKNNRDFSDDNILIETVIQNRKGIYDMDEYGTVSADELKDENGYVNSYEMKDGLTLVKLAEADKSYEALLQIRDGETHTATIGVNKPYTYKGWKFYLMGYDTDHLQYVNLYVKNDPGNIPFAVGIWMTVAGTFAVCFPFGKRKENVK